MTIVQLEAYGMKQIADVKVDRDQFVIQFSELSAMRWACCIYAFLINEQIVRIGSSKAPLAKRMREWELDVTKALQGLKSHTPLHEAESWRVMLPNGKSGSVWARIGAEVQTPVGTFNAYLGEESFLIGRHLPPLNHSKHR